MEAVVSEAVVSEIVVSTVRQAEGGLVMIHPVWTGPAADAG